MTRPDVRAFYTSLGIQLPARAKLEAPVRCFAAPDAHNHADRTPSCSVNLTSGAWNCHGCGAHGGAYDAALATGHTPRSAMDLLISHGLAEPRTSDRRPLDQTATRAPQASSRPVTAAPAVTSALAADENDVRHWAESLDADTRLVRRLVMERAWTRSTIRELEVGFDGARITIPIRDAQGRLSGVLRYDPFGPRDPKMLTVPGTRLGLVPHPAREPSGWIVLVEGPPDMIAARSSGLPAIATPGTNAWQPAWANLLAGKHITIIMDCDPPGRRAAHQIAASLRPTAKTVDRVDLSPDRHDGYDLTDRILEQRRYQSGRSTGRTIASLLRPIPASPPNPTRARPSRAHKTCR